MCFNHSTWQSRNVFWTKDHVYFSRHILSSENAGDTRDSVPSKLHSADSIIDTIPIDEIESISGSVDCVDSRNFNSTGFNLLMGSLTSRLPRKISNDDVQYRRTNSSLSTGSSHENAVQIRTEPGGTHSLSASCVLAHYRFDSLWANSQASTLAGPIT